MDVLLTRKGGRPSGEAFVVLGAPYQVQLQLDPGRVNAIDLDLFLMDCRPASSISAQHDSHLGLHPSSGTEETPSALTGGGGAAAKQELPGAPLCGGLLSAQACKSLSSPMTMQCQLRSHLLCSL